MRYLLCPAAVYLDYKVTPGIYVLTDSGRITGIYRSKSDVPRLEYTEVALPGLTLSPGFIDIHAHGGGGYDVSDISARSLAAVSEYKLQEGVTAFCPALVTLPFEKIKKAAQITADIMEETAAGAKIIGLFLEGPYINAEYRGAHPVEYIRGIDMHEIEELVSIGGIASVGLAPELKNAASAAKYLVEHNINVRIGHSAARAEETTSAIQAGASVAIHIYNAMAPLSHKQPSISNICLTNDDIYAEIICDLIHVNALSCAIAYRCKGAEKMILITDCIMAGGLSDGDYMLGETKVTVAKGIAKTQDGKLAGSVLTMDRAVWNMAFVCGVGLNAALRMATANPAMAMGIFNETGSVETGKKADLIAFNDDLSIKFVMADGVVKICEK